MAFFKTDSAEARSAQGDFSLKEIKDVPASIVSLSGKKLRIGRCLA